MLDRLLHELKSGAATSATAHRDMPLQVEALNIEGVTAVTGATSFMIGCGSQIPQAANDDPLSRTLDQRNIRSWLADIGETDDAIIAEVLDRCRREPEARAYFIQRSKEVVGTQITADDRRTCTRCCNLTRQGRCLAAWRGELTATAWHYSPLPAIPRRCERYAPKPGDPDPRPGQDRWPGLGAAQMESRYDA